MSQLQRHSKTAAFQEWRRQTKASSVGLVPTMGNLHQGHLSLLKEAARHHQAVVLTIFVNPKQFGPKEDFARYPRTLTQDLELIQGMNLQNEVVVFAPETAEEIFPVGYSTQISLGPLTQILCGQSRPGHFDGVTTVVYRLFALVKAQCAYFGQKDFQQLLLIKKMAQDLLLPTQVLGLPIVRDHDGLALSSRNQYLSASERQIGLALPRALQELQEIIIHHGLEQAQKRRLELLTNSHFEYLEIISAQTLLPPGPQERELVIVGALRAGQTRLIDNVLVNLKQ